MGAVDFTVWHRNDVRALSDVKQTFSSWDSCMAKAYCKWPAIVGIILGSLIVLGIAWCLIGCLCCGYTCCRGCCACCSCCPSGNNNNGGRQRSKYADPPPPAYHPPPPANYGYQPAAPPVYNNPPPAVAPVYNNTGPVPQYAQFDTPTTQKPIIPNEDALPHMPSWQNATTRRIEDTSPIPPPQQHQDMEMNQLSPTTGQTMGTTAVVGSSLAGGGGGLGSRTRSGYHEVPSQPSSPRYAPADVQNFAYPYQHNNHNGSRVQSPVYGDYQQQHQQQPIYRDHSPIQSSTIIGGAPYPRSQTNSPGPYMQQQQQQHTGYSAYAPAPAPVTTRSPPPPFSPTGSNVGGGGGGGRGTPGLLQIGRKPVENSYREV